MAKKSGKSIIGIYPGGSEYRKASPKKPTNPNIPKWQSFLATHPKKKANYDKLSPEEQLSWQEAFARGGAKAAKRYTQGVLRNRLPEIGTGPNINEFNVDTTKGIVNAAASMGRDVQNINLAANRPNETGPMGASNWNWDPITGRWTRSNTMTGAMGNLASRLDEQTKTNPFTDVSEARKRVEESVYQNYASKFEPQFAQEQENFRQQMANSGIPEGSAKYQKMQDQLLKSQEEMRRSWANDATTAGGQEQQRLSQQQIAQYNAPFQAFGNLAGANATWQKGFTPMSTINMDTPDVIGAATNMYQMGPYAENQQDWKMQQIALQNEGAMNVAETTGLMQQNSGGGGPSFGDTEVFNGVTYQYGPNGWEPVGG